MYFPYLTKKLTKRKCGFIRKKRKICLDTGIEILQRENFKLHTTNKVLFWYVVVNYMNITCVLILMHQMLVPPSDLAFRAGILGCVNY